MDDYDAGTATHYAAYRPPLHGPILRKLLGKKRVGGFGLDVGCGTGQSAVALSEYCRYVFAIDPSAAMLALAPDHSSVEFRQQTRAGLAHQLPGSRFGLVSFAGSLFYQDEVEAVLSFPYLLEPEAAAVVYDFDVDLNPVFEMLDFAPPPGEYDHHCGFDHYPGHGLVLKKDWTGTLKFSANGTEAAHLICSVKPWREVLLRGRTFEELARKLSGLFTENPFELKAACFGKLYNYKE